MPSSKSDFYSDLDPATPSENYDASMDGMLTFTRNVYDQQAVVELIKPKVMEDPMMIQTVSSPHWVKSSLNMVLLCPR